MDMKDLVLVSGGAGFIGSHLVDGLLKDGYKTRVLDNLAPPTHNGRLPEWFNKKAEFIKGDVRNKKDWEKCLKSVSYVFHLAAYMDYHLDFSNFYRTNTESTALLYEVIVEKNLPIKKIVVTSSQSVYGEGKYRCSRHGIFYPAFRSEAQLKKHQWEVVCPIDKKIAEPLAEKEDDMLTPQIPYGISKCASERTALVLGKIYGIPSVALRYSIVHGSRQSFRHFYSGALRAFSVMALSGKPIVMHEDGGQIRDFVNVHDAVDAHLKVLKNPRADFQAFNVGSGRSTKVVDLAKAVCKVAGVEFRPAVEGIFRVNTPRHSIMDISKLKRLGWRPKYSLEDNVKEYIDWVKKYPEAKEFLVKSNILLKKEGVVKK